MGIYKSVSFPQILLAVPTIHTKVNEQPNRLIYLTWKFMARLQATLFSGWESSFSKFANPQQYLFYKYPSKAILRNVCLGWTHMTVLLINHFRITWNFIKLYCFSSLRQVLWNKELVFIFVARWVLNLILSLFPTSASYFQLL